MLRLRLWRCCRPGRGLTLLSGGLRSTFGARRSCLTLWRCTRLLEEPCLIILRLPGLTLLLRVARMEGLLDL
jgi:hypothetical protein